MCGAMMRCALHLSLFIAAAVSVAATGVVGAVATSPFSNTLNGTHLFLTFDGGVNASFIATSLPAAYNFVWGAAAGHLSAYRKREEATGVHVVATQYWPFCRATSQPLSWWQENHPTWVLYKCDRKTPAYEFGDRNMPVDISNPDVLEWQLDTVVKKIAIARGYDGMAMDNFDLANGFRACGVFERASATNATLVWRQLYTGEPSDPVYTAAMVSWVERFVARVHELGLLVTLNWSIGGDALDDPAVLRVANATDAAVAEAGFTDYGSKILVGRDWVKRIGFMRLLQSKGKGYFSINEWRGNVTRAVQSWLLASYTMGKQRSASIFVSSVQGYGSLVDLPALAHFDSGVPLAHAPLVDSATGVYYRNTTTCVAVVNPWDEAQPLKLDPAFAYVDVWGDAVNASSSSTRIAGRTALVVVPA